MVNKYRERMVQYNNEQKAKVEQRNLKRAQEAKKALAAAIGGAGAAVLGDAIKSNKALGGAINSVNSKADALVGAIN